MNHCNNGGYLHTITTTTPAADTLHYFISWSSGVYSNSKTPLQISSQGFQKWKPRIATFLQLYLVYNITSRYSYIWWCLLAAISIVKALCSVLTSEESSIWYFGFSGFRIILTTQWKNGLVKASRRGLFFIFMSNCLNN